MTALDEPPTLLDTAEVVVVEQRRPRFPRGVDPRRLALTIGLPILIVALTVVLLENPVADLMYSQRQRERTSQYLDAAGAARIGTGDAVAVMQIPDIGLNVAVVEGDGAAELRGGPGHRIGSPLPGEVGNTVIQGRRTSFGGPFERLDELQSGALITVQVRSALSAVDYIVREVRTVPEHDTSPMADVNDSWVLTLVASDGGTFSQDRLIVVADYAGGLPLLPRPTGPVDPGEPTETALGFASPVSAAPSPAEEPEGGIRETGGYDAGVTFSGAIIALLWIGALVVLCRFVLLVRARFSVGVTAFVFTPLVLAVVLQLWLALDAMGPATR